MNLSDASDPIEFSEAELRHADSAKWTTHAPDVLPLWVADMDFAVAPSIVAALTERLSRPVGYHVFADPELTALLSTKLDRFGMTGLPKTGSIHFISGVVPGLYAGVFGLTSPGDEVLTMTPIYPPFLSAIADHGRVGKSARLKETETGWQIDWDALETACTSATKLLMICHPHNPTGRVWTAEELTRLAEFAERHELFVVCDELHADLTLDGPFVPFVIVASDAMKQRTITLTGPCKAYNTAGLGIGAMVSHNPALIERVRKSVVGISGHAQALSVAMWRAALKDDGRWLASVLQKLRGNRDFLASFIADRLPDVRFVPPQATYLAWLDYRKHPNALEIQKHLLQTAKVAMNDGRDFGQGFEGFVRLNFATSRTILAQALERLAVANSV